MLTFETRPRSAVVTVTRQGVRGERRGCLSSTPFASSSPPTREAPGRSGGVAGISRCRRGRADCRSVAWRSRQSPRRVSVSLGGAVGPASVQLCPARRTAGRACPRGTRHRARDVHRLRSGGRARDVRGTAGRCARLLRACRRNARVSQGARADAARARARGSVRADLRALPLGGSDLALLMDRFDEQFAAATPPIARCCSTPRWLRRSRDPLLLLDVPMESSVEFELVRRLIASSPDTLVAVPFGDLATLDHLASWEPTSRCSSRRVRPTSRRCAGTFLQGASLPCVSRPVTVMLFSAPGEERECVEESCAESCKRRAAGSRSTTSRCFCNLRARSMSACSGTRSSAPE